MFEIIGHTLFGNSQKGSVYVVMSLGNSDSEAQFTDIKVVR